MPQPFLERLQTAYRRFNESLLKHKTSEHDVRARFVEHVIKNGFGYDEKHCINEKDETDILLLDAPANSKGAEPVPIVVIETKDFNRVDNRSLVDQENISQAFKYAKKGATRYVALTNFKRFVLWRVEDTTPQQTLGRAVADVDLEAQTMYKTFRPEDMNKLAAISSAEIAKVYDDFTCGMKVDLRDKENFEDFTSVIKNRILDIELIPQFHRLAQLLASQFSDYSAQKQHLEKRRELLNEHASHATIATIDGELRDLEGTSRAAIEFENRYRQWERIVYQPNDTTSLESKITRFASETAYALLSRMLLIRIAEDKDILNQNISDGELARKVKTVRALNHAYKMVLQWAFTDAQNAVYKRLFQKDVYDWYWEGDGELNDAVKKALWHLNQYNFAGIQRDVFKYVYQHHMDKEERKRIGEYYTPDEVVCYILNRVGYTSDIDLRQSRLLDPAIGSGTFLVEAVSRLKKLGHGMTANEILHLATGESAGGVFGFDINPFAVYLTEANLLFQMIDLIQQTGRAVDEFQVHRTDTLEPPSALLLTTDVGAVKKVDNVKAQRFDFVVGNPPYVRTRGLLDSEKRVLDQRLRDKFPDILRKGVKALSTGQLDLYIVFMAFGIDWLSRDESRPGRLGFITSGKFLTGENGQWLRSLILRRCAIEEIVDVMRVKNIFKTQDVYPVMVILRYEPDERIRTSNLANIKIVLVDNIEMLRRVEQAKCVRVPDYNPNTEILAYSITQKQFEDHPENAFEIYLSDSLQTIISKIEQSAPTRLGDVLSIDRGVERGGQEKWEKRLKDRDIRHEYGSNFIVSGAEKETIPQSERAMLRIFVDGNTVAPFAPEYRDEYLCYDEEWLNSPKSPALFEGDEKIIIPRRGQSLFACLDKEKHYVLDDAYVGTLKQQEGKISLAYLVGFLNASTLDFYHKTRFMTRLQGDWFDFYDYTLSGLPIRQPDTAQESEIAQLVNALLARRKRLSTILRTTGLSRELVRSSGATTTRGVGLSRLVKYKKGVDNPIEMIRRKGARIEFNRERRKETYVELTDEEAARLLEDLIQKRYTSTKGQSLGSVLNSIEFPGDERSLHKINLYRRKLSAERAKLEKEFVELKERLDWKIAELCGLTKSEYELMSRALKLLTTTKTSQ